MVVIRLARGGAKKRPFFNIVATDSRNRRDGRFIERIGFYNPVAAGGEEAFRIVQDRLTYWQGVGAQLSPTVARLVASSGKKSSLSLSGSGMPVPDDLVLVGYVSGAYGINGWVRIKPYSADADALLHAKTWWLDKPELHDVEMLQSKTHGGDVVAQLMGVVGRDASEALKGTAVHIRRSHFPPLSNDEFYWVDLIGLQVENLEGEDLGLVADLMDNGAHPILRVRARSEGDAENPSPEMLIPFVERFVKTVDQKAKKITVDWGFDY